MTALVRILRFTRSFVPYYVAIMLAAIVTTLSGLAIPFLTGRVTDVIVEAIGEGTGGGGVPEGLVAATVRTVLLLAVAVLAVSLLETAVSAVGGYWGDVLAAKMRSSLSTQYFEKLLSLPQRYFDDEMTGTIVARLNRSISEITNFVKTFSNLLVTMLMTAVAVLVISAWYYWPLAVLLAISYPLYLWLTALTSRKWQRLESRKNEHVDIASGRFAEVVGQMRVVKSFVREHGELRHFDRHFSETVGITGQQSRYWHRMDALRRGVLNLIFFALYAMIFVRTVTGAFTPGEMVMLIQLVAMARQPIMSLNWAVDAGQRAIAGSRSYFEVMDEDPEPIMHDEHWPVRAISDPGALAFAFHDVNFGYEAGQDVLTGIDFSARQGERIALVSESGGGKTTIASLLMGLYRPRSGYIDVPAARGGESKGESTRESAGENVDLAALRRSIGAVFQEPVLFSGTIAENIAYGYPEATRDEIEAVARRAAVDRFVESFPRGYDTVIGERGMKLSGGQKQRIAVARAMLKDAPILVLDEATSALDTKSERLVQEGLDDLMRDRTSLIIAHRLSTIAEVDRIITLRDGRIDEIGSPEELAVSGGIYAELLALQNSPSKSVRKRLKRYDLTGG
ncbi:ABC transporter ATP-binding protein [Leucobacter sp. GX24907]